MDFLYTIDVNVFYFINHTLSVKFLDKFFLIITDVKNWYITYIILWCIIFFKGGRKGKIAAIGAIFLIVISDQVSSVIIKNLIARARPCHVLESVKLLVSCKSSYSFPSSHAVNNFAIAVYFLNIFPKYKWILLTTAFLVALSRPYIGIHYPSDIFAGALIGSAIGYLFFLLIRKIDVFFEKKAVENNN
jgi:undecaprenyl-diphosphatase